MTSTIEQDIQNLNEYLKQTSIPYETIRLALDLKTANNISDAGSVESNSTATNSDGDSSTNNELATSNKQDNIIRLLEVIKQLVPQNHISKVKGRVVEESATDTAKTFVVEAGAYSVGFWLIQGSCKIDGQSIPADNFVSFPPIAGSVYDNFLIELSANSKVQITESRALNIDK